MLGCSSGPAPAGLVRGLGDSILKKRLDNIARRVLLDAQRGELSAVGADRETANICKDVPRGEPTRIQGMRAGLGKGND